MKNVLRTHTIVPCVRGVNLSPAEFLGITNHVVPICLDKWCGLNFDFLDDPVVDEAWRCVVARKSLHIKEGIYSDIDLAGNPRTQLNTRRRSFFSIHENAGIDCPPLDIADVNHFRHDSIGAVVEML